MVGYIFDATKGETPKTLAEKRAIAKALLGAQRAPQNVGEGISALGDGIVARVLNERADAAEQSGMASAQDAFGPILAALGGGGGGAFPSAPAAPREPAVSTMDPLQTEAATGVIPSEEDARFTMGNSGRRVSANPRDPAIFNDFMGTVKGSVNNPYALAAIAATGQSESAFSPKNAYGEWNDPSERGVSGQSGGIMSWRADRLQRMRDFAQAQGDDPLRPSAKTQGAFFLQEDPTLIQKLQAAGSVEEAQTLMNNAWRFAGYNRAGGEAARRQSVANQFLPSFMESSPPSPAGAALDNMAGGGVQVASLDPAAGVFEAGAEQGIPADNAGLQALAKLKSGEGKQIAQALTGTQTDAMPEMAGNAPMGQGGLTIPQLLAAGSNPFMPESNQKIIDLLMQEEMKKRDPAYNLDLEKTRTELDLLKNPRMSPSERANYDLNVEKFGAENAQRMWDREYKGREFGLKEREFSSVDADRTADNTRADSELAIKQLEYMLKTQPDFYAKYTAQEEAAGRQPLGILDYAKQLKQAGAGNTNVTIGGEPADGELRKGLDKAESELWGEYKKQGAVSSSITQDFQILDELIKVAPQGILQGRMAEMFPGVSSAGDAFQSIVKRIAPTLRAPGSGATSDIEYDGMLKSLPALRNKPEANNMIGQIMKAKADLNMKRADIITAFQTGDMSAALARRQIADLDKQSIMSPEMKRALEGLGVTETGGTVGGAVAPGVVEDGYRFKGGNPGDPANWEKVQ